MKKSMKSFGKVLSSQPSQRSLPAAPLRKRLIPNLIPNTGRRRQIRPATRNPVQELDWLRYGYSGTAAAWVLAPIRTTRKVPAIFPRQEGSVAACANRYFDEFR